MQVTLLEPWEHAVLLLMDGSRSAHAISELLAPSIDDQTIDDEVVDRCLRYLRRQGLTVEPPAEPSAAPGPRTMAELQSAYAEWHKEPAKTGQHKDWLAPPLPGTGANIAPSLSPTVAMPRRQRGVGTTLLLAEADSLLGARTGDQQTETAVPVAEPQATQVLRAMDASGADELDVLSAVDSAVREANAVVSRSRLGASEIRADDVVRPGEVGLRPTMVGQPPARADEETSTMIPTFGDDALPHSATMETTSPGKLIAAPQTRARTVSTGARPPPGLTREIVEHLRALGEEDEDAGLGDVLGELDTAELMVASAHFARLRHGVPGSRRLTALVTTLESLVRQEAESAPSLSPRTARTPFHAVVQAIIDDAVAAGRCPGCLSLAAVGFRHCGSCGFEPSC